MQEGASAVVQSLPRIDSPPLLGPDRAVRIEIGLAFWHCISAAVRAARKGRKCHRVLCGEVDRDLALCLA